MKQILVGFTIVGVFIMYSLWVRHEQTSAKPALATTMPITSSQSTMPSSGSAAPPANTNTSNPTPPATQTSGYKDGTYNGDSYDATYGNVKVAAVVSGGKLTDVSVLDYPRSHDDSVYINQQALPMLKEEAVRVQDPSNIQIISGATYTSEAYIQSLTSALNRAKAA